MTALTSTDGTTFTINLPTNSSTTTSASTASTASTAGVCISNSGGGGQLGTYGPCIHGNYGQCYTCYPSYTQTCTCAVYGSVCPIHTLQNSGSITVTPSWTTWPPAPPAVDLHAKEGHAVTHEMVTDSKGLKIVFKCSFCSEVIYKKYIVRIPRKVREEKCLVRVLNHR